MASIQRIQFDDEEYTFQIILSDNTIVRVTTDGFMWNAKVEQNSKSLANLSNLSKIISDFGIKEYTDETGDFINYLSDNGFPYNTRNFEEEIRKFLKHLSDNGFSCNMGQLEQDIKVIDNYLKKFDKEIRQLFDSESECMKHYKLYNEYYAIPLVYYVYSNNSEKPTFNFWAEKLLILMSKGEVELGPSNGGDENKLATFIATEKKKH